MMLDEGLPGELGPKDYLDEPNEHRRQLLWSFGRAARSLAELPHLILHESAQSALTELLELISPSWGVFGIPPRPDLETLEILSEYEDNDDLVEDFDVWSRLPNGYARRKFVETGGLGPAFTVLLPSTTRQAHLHAMCKLWDDIERDDYYGNIERSSLWLSQLPAAVLPLAPDGCFFYVMAQHRSSLAAIARSSDPSLVFPLEVGESEVHWPGVVEV